MRLQRLIAVLVVAAATGLSAVQVVCAGQTWNSYAQQRCVIRAAILVPGGYPATPSPYTFYLLGSESAYVALEPYTDVNGNGRWDSGEPYTDANSNGRHDAFDFYPPRPAGWEIINPVATPGVDRSDPAYWTIAASVVDLPLLQNFDLLLLPIIDSGPAVSLTVDQQWALRRWVDQGGLLWIDSQPGPNPGDDPQLGDFFLHPRVQFGVRNRTDSFVKAAVDRNHPLLRSRHVLSEDDVQWLGQQYAYGTVGDPANAGLSPLDSIIEGVNNPFSPNDVISSVTLPQEVVGQFYDVAGARRRVPVIAAGRYGDGGIVISACGVAAGISNWYADINGGAAQTATELPQWALPDMKLAYNMIQWWMEWSGVHGRVRFTGGYAESLPGPPLLTWDDVTTLGGQLAGAATVDRGLAFAGSASGILGAWDSKPYRDRGLDGQSDDGAADYADGTAHDLLWSVTVPWQDPNDANPRAPDTPRQVVGSPAVASTRLFRPIAASPAGAVRAGNVVIITTLTEHWFEAGDEVLVSGVTSVGGTDFNGTFVIATVPSNDSFTYAQTDLADTGGGGTVYSGSPTRLVAAAVKTTDNLDCSLHTYLADAPDADSVVADPNPVWSATIKRYDRPQPEDNSGLVRCGPVTVDPFFALLTTDSGTLEAPNRDAQLLLYDAAGPTRVSATYYEEPAARVKMTRGGRAMSFANPPAIATIEAWDEVWQREQPVQAAVMTGDTLPRPGPSAVGWLNITPLMVRVPAPGWNRAWLLTPAVGDVADNQAVVVLVRNLHPDNPEVYPPGDPRQGWIQVPPHVDNDPTQPLNYVRSVSAGQISITFTQWSLFGWGPAAENRYPLGFGDIWIRYRDTQDNWRDLGSVSLSPGTPTALNGMLVGSGWRTASASGFVNEAGYASPCVVGDDVYVGTDAVNAYPSPSSEGQIVSYSVGAGGAASLNWRFTGDRYRGQTPTAADGYYFASFSFTPAYSADTLFAVSNYRLFQRQGDQRNVGISGGASGALYALEPGVSPELVRRYIEDGKEVVTPVLPSAVDPVAPRNDGVAPPPYSADPNQVVPSGRTGAAVWISTNTDPASPEYNSPRYAVPQVSGTQSNWRVDFQNGIIRLEAGAFGDLACPVWDGTRYVPQQMRVRYFSGGVIQDVVMEVTPLVKWLYLAPAGWEFVSSPLVSNDMVMVVAHDHANQRYLLLGFRAVPEDTTFVGSLSLWAVPTEPEYVQVLANDVPSAAPCSLAVTEGGVVWSAQLAGFGDVAALASPETIIADNNRLLAVDPGGRALTAQDSTWHMRPGVLASAAGWPAVKDSYAERIFQPLERPTRVRVLPDGNLLVVDSGTNCVMELDSARNLVWRYPNDDPAADLGGMTAEQAQLLSPSDAQRYYYQESVAGADFVDPEGVIRAEDVVTVEWVTTLIADTGKYRIIEVARPLINGRYRPDVERDWNPGGAPDLRVCSELVREIAGPALTDWPTAAGGSTKVQAAFTTATRLTTAAPYPFMSSGIMCGVGNNPPDPLGQDQYVRLVGIAVAYADYAAGQPLAAVTASQVLGRGTEGINVFRPRTSPWTEADAEQLPRDFLGVRQADLTVVQDPGTGLPRYQTLIVDDVGVKVVDNATWNDPNSAGHLTPVFEMRGAAPWLHSASLQRPGHALTTYEEEMLAVEFALRSWAADFGDPATSGTYPPLISEPRTGLTEVVWNARRALAFDSLTRYVRATMTAGFETGSVPFLPFYAKRLRNGHYLIVNGYPDPYRSEGPLEVMAPVTSELLEVNPAQPVGERLIDWRDDELDDTWNLYLWSHLIVPDPGRSEYPLLRGGAGPLRQCRAVDMR